MITRPARISLVLAVIALAPASAQQPAPPPAFQFERPIVAGAEGARRLAVDVPLLVGAKPFTIFLRGRNPVTREPLYAAGGLGDLRLFDSSGRDVGYLLVSNPPIEPVWKPSTILPVAPVETENEKTSGFEADLGDIVTVDRLRIDRLMPPFLKRVRLEGSGDRAHWTLLVAEGTLFDLPGERLRQIDLDFKPGAYRYLRVTWDDTRSGRVTGPFVATARTVTSRTPPPPLTAPLAFDRRPSEPGRSHFRVRLPGAHLPILALDLDVGGEHLLRNVQVYESRLSGDEAVPVALGEETIRRVVQGPLTASSLRVWIHPPSAAELELNVNDGDNPPLDLRGVKAIFAELPWIYFESAGGGLVARYGNATLDPPRYDLEAVRDKIAIDAVADAAWGDARARTSEENAAAAAPPLPVVGASLDPTLFKYVRAIPSGDAGLVALPLDPSVLAHSTGVGARFADVRVIDSEARQLPYLVERASEPLTIDLKLERLSTLPKGLESQRPVPSVYRVRWPFERLPAPRLVLTTTARVFRRGLMLGREHEPDRNHRDPWVETMSAMLWVHADQDKPAPAITFQLPTANVRELLVIVDEGDNTPLPLASAQLLLPAYRLRFFRERDAALRLVYGRSDLDAPRYDLALLAPQVLSVPATDVAAAAESTTAEGTAREFISPRLFWIVLAVAVLVLLGLIVRLVRREEPTQAPRSG